jgi:hypothetical protein
MRRGACRCNGIFASNFEAEAPRLAEATLLYSSDAGHIDERYVVDTPIGGGEAAQTSTR